MLDTLNVVNEENKSLELSLLSTPLAPLDVKFYSCIYVPKRSVVYRNLTHFACIQALLF